jgi:hypothetical protein
MAGFLGMRATDDWSTDVRPKSFRQGILLEFPNGDAPLTAITSAGGSEQATDPEFTYWSKDLAAQSGAVTSVFQEADLTDAWAGGDTTGAGNTNIFAQMAEAVADEIRVGHIVLLITAATPSQVSFGKVIKVQKNGASSYVQVKSKITDAAAGYLATVDTIDIIGDANPEGGSIPDAVTYDPVKYTNYTQIFRTPLDITRTARLTKLRTGDAYTELKRETLLYHGVAMEMAAFFGEKSEVDGDNGKPERTTQGGYSFCKENANAANVSHFPSTTSNTWLQDGEEWLEDQFEIVFRRGRSEKVAWTGSGGLRAIQKLVKQSGQFQLSSETGAYGIKVVRWTTPFGDIMLKRHPLFTHKSHRTNDMFIHEVENLQFTHITDTIFKKDDSEKKAGSLGVDGTKEEFLTEAGYEWHFPNTMSLLTGVGTDGV